MAFYRGQKVVCVDTWPRQSLSAWLKDTWLRWRYPYTNPVKGAIYTVTNVYIADDGDLTLELAEITDGDPEVWSPGYRACGFRPVVERKTDIGFAHEILRKATKRQGADA